MIKISLSLLAALFLIALIFVFYPTRQPADEITASSLQQALDTYSGAGPHRSGGTGDFATRDWIAEELAEAGYTVELQSIPIRQWRHDAAFLETESERLEGFPLWWPETTVSDRAATGALLPIQQASSGDIGVLEIDPHLLSQLQPAHARQILEAEARGVSGVVVITSTISGEAFAFNAWSDEHDIPVLILGSKHSAEINKLIASEVPITLQIQGAYFDTETWNVIGRLDRAGNKTVAVSTPRTGWFNCAAERGPGIALFVELAKWAPKHGSNDLVFVATGGHEIGHVGMDQFMENGAPSIEETQNWIHLGSSIAAFDWTDHSTRQKGGQAPQNTETRWIIYSGNMTLTAFKLFRNLGYKHSPAYISAFGEAKDIKDAGYRRFLAFAGSHPYFHLISDTSENTSGDILAPTAIAIQQVLLKSL